MEEFEESLLKSLKAIRTFMEVQITKDNLISKRIDISNKRISVIEHIIYNRK